MSLSFPSDDVLTSGHYCGVFIDDTGTPGQSSPSPHLDPSRKTWVALVLSSSQLATVYREFPGVLQELHRQLGVSEFHATELLSGKGLLRGVPIAKRFAVFEFLAHIFASYQFPLLVQTAGERTIADHEESFNKLGTIGPFDFTSPPDAGLLLLILKVRRYLREGAALYSAPGLIAIDEGRMTDGAFIPAPGLADFTHHRGIFFRNSASTFPIQLADFAAFGLNRMQWLMAKADRTEREKIELTILADASFNCVNLPKMPIDLATWKGADFDKFHVEDRLAKGLSLPNPRKEE